VNTPGPHLAGRSPAQTRARLRSIFTRVMIVQVITLALLWLLQSRFGTG
jgi:hypothetical protein